ncbi:hypothetical protein C9I92_10415 [Photobacterium ganghwense]|uniref:Uncharacterized protein n=2 Tax=Photobacterium ganghwense TaxID=320778 RepID=A0A0J1HF35_9GAMM|nr:hypothetical protein [Photobacterium ganghwense]KLV10218.1 hypothetical protein ABT57_06490 [Photobacterium ganghwense]PSU09905.1 hypothetical protein C9I92_10415 [Photobacterium ganghwense]
MASYLNVHMDNFKIKPDAYVTFSWKGRTMEGEFFRVSKGSNSGVIRPFDRALRQELVDDKLISRVNCLEKNILIDELVTCDGIATDESVKVGDGTYNTVQGYDFIGEGELKSNDLVIADCRLELLRRQLHAVYSKLKYTESTYADRKEIEALKFEFKKYSLDKFKPLRYKLTRKKRVWQYVSTHPLWSLLLIVILLVLVLLN